MIINELKKNRNPFVFIIDNNFFGDDESYMFDLFDEIKKNKIKKVFFAGVSVGFFKNEKLVARAAECGLKMVFVGFESDTVQSLKELNKKNYKNADDIFNEYLEIVRLSHKHGILISGKVMIGIENDTEELINKRINFFTRLKLDELSCAILTPLPMSGLFKQLQNEGRLLYHDFPADWIKYDYNNLSFKLQTISKEKVDNMQTLINAENRPKLKHILNAFLISRSLKGVFLYYAYSHYFFYYKNKFISAIIRLYARLNGYEIPKFN